MPVLSVAEIVDATGGELLRGSAATTVDSYSIDTRTLAAGGAFFALPGNRTDGHDFVGAAAQAQAALALVARSVEGPVPEAVVAVGDVEQALTACGQAARKKIEGPLRGVDRQHRENHDEGVDRRRPVGDAARAPHARESQQPPGRAPLVAGVLRRRGAGGDRAGA